MGAKEGGRTFEGMGYGKKARELWKRIGEIEYLDFWGKRRLIRLFFIWRKRIEGTLDLNERLWGLR